jgi:hypothetical protein
MPKYLQPKNMEEAVAAHQLPIVIELEERGRRTLYIIKDYERFHEEQVEAREPGDIFPDYEEMKKLAKKHGEKMKREDFERGGVFVALSGTTTGKGTYTEYRFKAPEAEKK